MDTIETLPWRSATERTVATAPLRLEKGLTVFLKCGNVVHAILRNSQCWCVDGASKFVLRIGPLTYYRIEIPNETEDDKASVADLKAALPTVLRYEVTPCPFKRAFTVELPEEAMAPRRKRAWRPKERKGSVPLIPESNQGSPSEPKSEWIDSASTGEDTDGGATDDSALTPQRTNSTTSEVLPLDEQSPTSSVFLEPPPRQAPMRRSVTETPQTFTSLIAKFDTTPPPEGNSSPEHKPLAAAEATGLFQSEAEVQKPPEVKSEAVCGQQESTEPEYQAEHEPSNSELDYATKNLHVHGPMSELLAQPEGKPEVDYDYQPPLGSLHQDPSDIEADLGDELEPDHDASFASSPDSFHSADLPSPTDSTSHTTPVECQDTLQKELVHDHDSNAFVTPSVAIVNPSTIQEPPSRGSSNSVAAVGIEPSTAPSNPGAQTVRNDIPRPSLTIPSSTATRTPSSVKATSPSTDFNHMSTEFRRRAQATRKRDTSPMPPPSAIYQPVAAQDATSLLSKALTLVLVPPVSLFIVLLHIAARIVINPAVDTTFRDTSQSSSKAAVPEDDFSFPLEREPSSESEDARISKKLDPWDLD